MFLRASDRLRPTAGDRLLQPQGGDHGADVIVDLSWGAGAVNTSQQAALVVEVDQRGGLVVIDLQPVLDDLGLVVVALNQA